MIRILVFGACLNAFCVWGQYQAQIGGVVRDVSGAVVGDASVVVVSEETGMRRAAHSNGFGEYAVASLQGGTYKITARKEGFHTVVRTGLTLQPATTLRIDFVLQVGSVHEVVTIVGDPESAGGGRDTGAALTVIPSDFARHLPLNDGGLHSFLDLAPGVVITPAAAGEAGQFSANGQRANANYVTVDGVSANTSVSGGGAPGQFSGSALPGMTAIGSLHNLATLGAIDTVVIRTSSFTPEFGRMPGAQIAISTRSGSNTLHGSGEGVWRPGGIAADDVFLNGSGVPAPSSEFRDFLFDLGGPLIRNKTFFYGSFEHISLVDAYVFQMAVPSLAARNTPNLRYPSIVQAFPFSNGPRLGSNTAQLTAAASRPSRVDSGSFRVDQSLGSRSSLFLRLVDAPSSNAAGYLGIENSRFTWETVTAGVTTVFGATQTNDIRLNFSHATVSSSWQQSNVQGAAPPDLAALFPGVSPGTSWVYGVSVNGLPQLISGENGRNSQNQVDLADSIAVTRSRHDLRAGVEYIRLTPSRDRALSSAVGSFASLDDVLNGAPMQVTYAQAAQASSLIETVSFFGQDTFHVTPRLTLNYGARWEFTPSPAVRGAATTGTNSWPLRWNQFAPRAGVAYALNEQRSWVLRAGAGLFYDLGFSSAADPVNGIPYNRWVSFPGASAPSAPVSTTSGPSINYTFAPNLRLPRAFEWNVMLEGALAGGTASAAYIGSAGRDLLRREGAISSNGVLPSELVATNHGSSDYNALQLQYRRVLRPNLRVMGAYTWSHAIDTNSWDSALMLVFPGAGANQDRANANFDVRHDFTAGLQWEMPWKLELDGMLRARSGFPIDVLSAENDFGLTFDNAFRPNLVAGQPLWISDSLASGGQRLNPLAFAIPVSGQGDLGRNAIAGFGHSQLDVAVARTFELRHGFSIEARVESFNFLNQANYADPVRFLSSALFGQSTSLLNLMLGTGTPHSGLSPGLQMGGPRTAQFRIAVRF